MINHRDEYPTAFSVSGLAESKACAGPVTPTQTVGQRGSLSEVGNEAQARPFLDHEVKMGQSVVIRQTNLFIDSHRGLCITIVSWTQWWTLHEIIEMEDPEIVSPEGLSGMEVWVIANDTVPV